LRPTMVEKDSLQSSSHSSHEDVCGPSSSDSRVPSWWRIPEGTESEPPGRPQSVRPSQSSPRRRRANKFILPDRHIRSGSLAARPSMNEVRVEKNDIVSTEGADRLPAGPAREHSDDTDLRSRLKRVEDGVERIRRKLLMSAGYSKSGSTRGREESVVRPCRAFKLGKRRLLEEVEEEYKPSLPESTFSRSNPVVERPASVTQVSRAIERCVDSLCSKRLDDYADPASMSPHSRKAAVRLFDVISIDLECLRRQIRLVCHFLWIAWSLGDSVSDESWRVFAPVAAQRVKLPGPPAVLVHLASHPLRQLSTQQLQPYPK
ncbi:hypothetical protein FOZ62_005949, partial [Perkinsus olseni]